MTEWKVNLFYGFLFFFWLHVPGTLLMFCLPVFCVSRFTVGWVFFPGFFYVVLIEVNSFEIFVEVGKDFLL